jgi:fimbrial chaperone protein
MTSKTKTAALSRVAAASVAGAGILALLSAGTAKAQSLTVLPVNIEMAPGQMSTTMTVVNQGTTESSVQLRAFAWSQKDGKEVLTSSEDVVASPPAATIAPGATQVVRLVLRKAPGTQEASYRILLDQIPPPAAPGTVRISLRLSIPVFAEPTSRAVPHMQYRVENANGKAWLVAVNDGGRHDTVRSLALTGGDGATLKTEASTSPYVLAGATSRWAIVSPLPPAGGSVHLTGTADGGTMDQSVSVPTHN